MNLVLLTASIDSVGLVALPFFKGGKGKPEDSHDCGPWISREFELPRFGSGVRAVAKPIGGALGEAGDGLFSHLRKSFAQAGSCEDRYAAHPFSFVKALEP